MIYLEHDDGHNEPITHSYEDEERALLSVVGPPPDPDEVVFGHRSFSGPDDPRFVRRLADWTARRDEAREALFGDPDYGGSCGSYCDCDTWTVVDAEEMHRRAGRTLEIAEAMERGEEL